MTTALDFAGLSGLEALRAMFAMPEPPPNIGSFLGMRVERLEEGDVAFSLPTRPEYANPLGTLHGGICATLLDSVMACAVHSRLPAGVGYGTLELKVNYVRAVPADGGLITAAGTTVHVGRSTATAEGRVTDAEGRLVAHGTTTCMIYR
ncbi:PaaI family thioesterase [Actinokineospora fastidiosa]|uniref:Thioesterase domain-containing protein n=1 Tax=Actinokineospora fastidiosa TaxID=1816 RepID=A0A918LCY7_9PSEU|nr:PaaI family thioesterase [Actinokineospora fastidiosa]GGS32922.1 hypothetical protein GCM10010171_28760 [Actinokineospora fastidiosa]